MGKPRRDFHVESRNRPARSQQRGPDALARYRIFLDGNVRACATAGAPTQSRDGTKI
jgi:hypothetical protein